MHVSSCLIDVPLWITTKIWAAAQVSEMRDAEGRKPTAEAQGESRDEKDQAQTRHEIPDLLVGTTNFNERV